jgi:TRAP-type C4-dicarboxylate transport system permease small subunit
LKILENLAKTCAVLAGVLLTGITLMTCVSLIGRNTTGWTIVGDFELSGSAAGAAIALFMPWCQVRRANIIVDFFTAKASIATRTGLDRLGALLLGLTMALMTWRNPWMGRVGFSLVACAGARSPQASPATSRAWLRPSRAIGRASAA